MRRRQARSHNNFWTTLYIYRILSFIPIKPMNLYTKPYITISSVPDNRLLVAQWTEESESLKVEEFQAVNEFYVQAIHERGLTFLLINAQKFNFLIAPDLQNWVAEQIIPQAIGFGLKKIAFVMSKEFVAQLSIEQTMDEVIEKPFDMQYFDDEDKAYQWIHTSSQV